MREHALAHAKAIGARLRGVRRRAELSQRALAYLADVTPSYLCQVEDGRRGELSVTHLARVADVLGLSFDWLIAGRGEAPSLADVCASVACAEAARSAVAPKETSVAKSRPRRAALSGQVST